jgi:hypothetical protein
MLNVAVLVRGATTDVNTFFGSNVSTKTTVLLLLLLLLLLLVCSFSLPQRGFAMARSADAQRGIGRGHSQGSSCSSARREHRSVIPDDFPAEDRRPEEIRRRLFVAGNGQMSNHNDLSKEVCKKEEAAIAVGTEKEGAPMILGGRESPASSLLIFGDDDQSALSSVSSVSPTSVTQLVSATAMPLGGEKDPSFLRRVLAESLVAPSSAPAPLLALAAIDLHRLIDDSNWTELNRVLGALQLSSSAPSSAFDRDAVERALESTNSRGETPVHTLAWKAPTELVLQALDVRGVSALLSRGDRDLNTPLHLACANVADRSDFAVIRQIAFLAPHALALRNDHGDTRMFCHFLLVTRGGCLSLYNRCLLTHVSFPPSYPHVTSCPVLSPPLAGVESGVRSVRGLSQGGGSVGDSFAPHRPVP